MRHLNLLISILSLPAIISCGGKDPAPTPEPVSGIQIIANNVVQYAVVCPGDASLEAHITANRICSDLTALSGTLVDVVTSSSGDDVKEIIVGAGVYAPASELYSQITYGSYMLALSGKKILVSAMDSDSYLGVSDYLSEKFYDKYKKKTGSLTLDEVVFRNSSVVGVSGYVPPFKVDKAPVQILQTGSNSDKDKAMQVEFDRCGDSDFSAYCSELEKNGYVKACDNAFGKCFYATYKNSSYQVGVSLYKETGLMRIVSEPAYEKPIWTIEGTPGTVQPLMMQVYQDNVKYTSSHPGGYVVRLSDGRFMIFDTGDTAIGTQLMDYMRSRNTFKDGKVHIALIMISHPHDDHRCGLNLLASQYASEIVCEAVAFNMTNHKRQTAYAESTLHGRLNEMVNSATTLGAPCYCLRAGQVINLAGAKLEVLFTPDELGDYILTGKNPTTGETDTNYDQNNSSNMVRLTVGGQKITFTGDCRGGEAGIFNTLIKSSFESDIMTVAHHGFNVSATLQMYTKAKPFALFWNVRKDEQDMTRYFDQQLMAATWVKKHFFEEEMVEIELPYILPN